MQTRNYFNVTFDVSTTGNCDGKMKHAEHDIHVKHSNKNIDFSRTKFNRIWHSGKTTDDVLKETYQPYFDEYNKKARNDRKVTNINEWFRRKKGYVGNDFTAVLTVGTKEEWNAFKELCHAYNQDDYYNDLVQNQIPNKLEEYAQKFNERHENMELINYAVNVDESSPHIHMQVVKKGFTNAGKPSPSLNVALKKEYNQKNNQRALSAFNQDECKNLQDDLDSVLSFKNTSIRAQELSKIHDEHVSVKRPMGMSQEDYIATMQLADEARKQQAEIDKLKVRKKQLQDDNKALEQEKQDNQSLIDDMQEQQQELQESNRQLMQDNKLMQQDYNQFYMDNQGLQQSYDRLSGQYDDLVSSYNDTRNAFQNYLDTTVPELQAKAKQDAMQANRQALDDIEDANTLAPILDKNKRYNHKKRKKQRDYGPDL